jgi:rubrerythrin
LDGISPKDDQAYYVCQICGHVTLGFIPENCPVCHAVPGRFKRVD